MCNNLFVTDTFSHQHQLMNVNGDVHSRTSHSHTIVLQNRQRCRGKPVPTAATVSLFVEKWQSFPCFRQRDKRRSIFMQCNDEIDFKRSRNTGTAVQGRPCKKQGFSAYLWALWVANCAARCPIAMLAMRRVVFL